ncbi:MAG TPA: META domain-containing protein [Vicinamibacterales bacterium]|nr:META domain-containing protein [Vicinamibacterales bacterium]
MNHIYYIVLPIALTALVVSACSQSVSSPTAVSSPSAAYTAAQLEGTWTLTSIAVAGQAKQDRPFSAIYTLDFNQGRLSTRADCNTCGGSYSIDGSVLTAGPGLACTRAACSTMAFENAYTGILSGDSTMAVTGSTLSLSSSRGTLKFVRN